MSKTSKGRNGGKQKAWRLGAAILDRTPTLAKVGKPMLTLIGSTLRDNPGLLRHVMRTLQQERQRLAPCGYKANHWGRSNWFSVLVPGEVETTCIHADRLDALSWPYGTATGRIMHNMPEPQELPRDSDPKGPPVMYLGVGA